MSRPNLDFCSRVWIAGLLTLTLTGCASRAPSPSQSIAPSGKRTVTLLAINDVYRIEGVDGGASGGMARLRTLRAELERQAPDLLVLHAGDLLYPSLASRLYDGAQMIDLLNVVDGLPEDFDQRLFVTYGNHEFDKEDLEDAPRLDARLEESAFTWLGSDIVWETGGDGLPLVDAPSMATSALVKSGGVQVGIFSLTTDFEQPAYIARFEDPVETAREMTAELRRRGAELVVGLTHLRLEQDLALLKDLGDAGPDLVIGGHEHDRKKEEAGGRWVFKADAEARSASVVRVHVPANGGRPRVEHEFVDLDVEIAADALVASRVEDWQVRLDADYCGRLELPVGCLDEVFGQTRTRLVGEELEIRRFETNLGSWTADQALAAYPTAGAQVAFVNSGSLRLNQDIPPGPVRRRDIEEIFQYSAELVVLRLTGAVLQEIIDRSIGDWTGNGRWLQIAGFAYRHDSDAGTAGRLTLLGPDGPRSIAPDEELIAVTTSYVAGGGDGYVMLKDAPRVDVEPLDLKDVVEAALRAAGETGISPEIEGRICNVERGGVCLALER